MIVRFTFVVLAISSICLSAGAETPFNVGIIIPLSGDLAGYGDAIRNGFELAREEQPEKFSKIKFEYEDSRYDGKVAISALTALRTRTKVNLFYTWGVSPNEALIPVIESNRLATIAETTLKTSTVGKKYVVRAARTGEMLAASLLAEMQRRDLKRIGMLVTEIPYYTDIVAALESQGSKLGIEVAIINNFLGTDTDFRNSIANIKRGKFDAIGIFLLPDQIISYFRQADELKLSIKTFGSDIPDSQKLIDACSNGVDGLFFTSIGVTKKFRRDYVRRFSDDAFIGSAAQSYDMAMLIAELFGFADASSLSNEQILERIKNAKPQHGATGDFQFTSSVEDGMAFRMPVVLKGVSNHKIVDLGSMSR